MIELNGRPSISNIDKHDAKNTQYQSQSRSNDVQDVLGQMPQWTIKWGITGVFLILTMILVAGYFIKYPDMVSSRIIINITKDKTIAVTQIKLPANDAKRVVVNQKVNIRFDRYPSAKYGIIRGRVRAVTAHQENSLCLIEIEIPSVLKTSYQKHIPYQQIMSGNAEIIVPGDRIIRRIFDRFIVSVNKLLN